MRRMQKWEKFFDECVREIAKEDVVLDIGSGHPLQKEFEKYKGSFTGLRYYSLDYDSSYHPDIVADIHNLPFNDGSVDAIICKAVLEHVPEPQRAVSEMHRVLRKGGKIFAYVPFLHGYHGAENYKDYYRFTKDGVKYMFRHFVEVKTAEVRGYFGTLALFVPGNKYLTPLTNFLDRLTGHGVTSGYNIFAVK